MIKSTLFSHSELYAKYRIIYPDELFTYLKSLVPSNHIAWDVGTGTGQAAISLARHFKQIVASDINPNQIAQCPKDIENAKFCKLDSFEIERIGEELELKENSVDLVLVAQAVHWFPLEEFHRAVKYVLKENGIYAILTYVLPVISPSVDRIVEKYHNVILDPFWAEENKKYVHKMYKTIDFPFQNEIQDVPKFSSKGKWNLAELLGYLNSWSATQIAAKKLGKHPIFDDPGLIEEFQEAWGNDSNEKKDFYYPLYLRIAKK